MYTAYIFPFSGRDDPKRTNPYVRKFAEVTGDSFRYLNVDRLSMTGTIDILLKCLEIDVLFLNWVENIPDRRLGVLQVFIYVLAVKILELRCCTIVYTLHNKSSHSPTWKRLKQFVMRFTVRNASLILTHASEGRSFLRENYPDLRATVKVLPHPVDSSRRFVDVESEPAFDLLIWGALLPYKGVLPFLEAVAGDHLLKKFRIKIVGKAPSMTYFESLQSAAPMNVEMENRFVDFDEVEELTKKSRATLFTYQQKSVLSSGALMDALSLGAFVIGPRVGEFVDLEELGFVSTYRSYGEIPRILENSTQLDRGALRRWLCENTWEEFGKHVSDWVEAAVPRRTR